MNGQTARRAVALAGLVLALAGCSTGQVTSALTSGGQPTRSTARPVVTVTVTARPTTAKPSRSAAPTTASVPTLTPEATVGCADSCGAVEPVIFAAGSYSGIEPSSIHFSGDGGNIPYGLVWQSWPTGPNGWPGSGATATANGTVDLLGCVPACYDGTKTPTPVTVVLSDPIDGDPVTWGQIAETVAGQPPEYFTYPSFWPFGAS